MSNVIFMREVGDRLKKRRKELGLTQAELTELLNKSDYSDDILSYKQVSRVESGHNCTRLDKFVHWCLSLGKTPDYFLLGIDNGIEEKQNKINKICEYLKMCDECDVDNTLVFVKAMYDKKH